MTGKLIHNLKRKRDEASSASSSDSNCSTPVESSSPPSPHDQIATTSRGLVSPQNNSYNSNVKRQRNNCDTPDSTSSESEPIHQNNIMLDALKKLIELENELDSLIYEDDNEDDIEVSQIIGRSVSNYDAEALGFATCARETLLFLQNEGISENSILYKSLKEKLVGNANGANL